MKLSKLSAEIAACHQAMIGDIHRHLDFDHYVLGCGSVEPDGTVSIDIDRSVCSFDDGDEFMARYNNFQRVGDVLNRLHASFPESLIVWTDSTAREHTKASKSIEEWGADKQVRHLMLSGIASSFGRTWLTLYRTDRRDKSSALPAFTRADAEYVRYSVPQLLYGCQKLWAEVDARSDSRSEAAALLKDLTLPEPVSRCSLLTPYEMFLVIAYAHRKKPDDTISQIAAALPEKTDTPDVSAIRVAYTRALKKLEKSEHEVLTLLMGRQCPAASGSNFRTRA